MTSAEMLQRTYLWFIEEEATAKRARAQIRPGDWSMVKQVDLLEQFYSVIRSAVPQCRQTDAMLLGLLKDVAEANGYLFNPHKNGLIDKQRLSGERWNRWVALGLDQSTKKSGGTYQKDDRVTVFRISKDGAQVEKNALELLIEQV